MPSFFPFYIVHFFFFFFFIFFIFACIIFADSILYM